MSQYIHFSSYSPAADIVVAAICLVMNLLLIPAIESGAAGLRCFDMRFGYAYPEALSFLSALSAEGKRLYLTRQLPLDFLYPAVYGVFFALLFSALAGRKTPWAVLPALLAGADYCENILILLMLRGGEPSFGLVAFSSIATLSKTILMYLCFLMAAVLLVRKAAARLKRKKAAGGTQK